MKILLLIIIAVLVASGFLIFRYSKQDSALSSQTPEATPTPSPSPTSDPVLSQDIVKAVIVTQKGNIEIELYTKIAPKTVSNFLKLSREKFYDGTKFHRVVKDFVIQGGDPLSKTDDPNVGTGGPGYRFEDEINPKKLGVPEVNIQKLEAAGYKYDYNLQSLPVDVGALAMANAGPNTNGSQFFIVTAKNQPGLNGLHTVFGRVIKGMNVVLAIKQGDVVKSIEIK